MFLSVDNTFWVQLINFVIFIALLNVVFLKPVGAALKKRRAYIDSVKNDLERFERQSGELRGAADGRRVAARRKAEETIVAARGAAEAEADSVIAAATERGSAIADDARRTVAREFEAAKANERSLSEALAKTLLDRATGARA